MTESKPKTIGFDAAGMLIDVEIKPDTENSAYATKKTTLVCHNFDVEIVDYDYNKAVEKMRAAIAKKIGLKSKDVKIHPKDSEKGQYMVK